MSPLAEEVLGRFSNIFKTVHASACMTRQLYNALQPKIILVLGHKNSNYKAILERCTVSQSFKMISVSSLLKETVSLSEKTKLGMDIADHYLTGRPVPVHHVVSLIRHKVLQDAVYDCYVVDGFPRVVAGGFPYTHDQLHAFHHQIGKISKVS